MQNTELSSNFFSLENCKYPVIKFKGYGNCRCSLIYEMCPKSVQPAFISSRQSARAASAGYARNQ